MNDPVVIRVSVQLAKGGSAFQTFEREVGYGASEREIGDTLELLSLQMKAWIREARTLKRPFNCICPLGDDGPHYHDCPRHSGVADERS